MSIKQKSSPHPNSLEILDDGECRGPSATSKYSRSKSSSDHTAYSTELSHLSRVSTPTKKQISLVAVKRKQENDYPIEPELDWREFTRSKSQLQFAKSSSLIGFEESNMEESTSAAKSESVENKAVKCSQQQEVDALSDEPVKSVQSLKGESDEVKEGESSEEEDSISEEEPRKAPNELLMEFLQCLMTKDFNNAEKLCRMILIYEPNNAEALKFHPVILEKIELDRQASLNENNDNEEEDDNETDGDEEDNETDGDEEDNEDDSEEDSSLNSSSSDDSDDENEDDANPPRPDSGIGM